MFSRWAMKFLRSDSFTVANICDNLFAFYPLLANILQCVIKFPHNQTVRMCHFLKNLNGLFHCLCCMLFVSKCLNTCVYL